MNLLPSTVLLGALLMAGGCEQPRPCPLPYLGSSTEAPKLEVWTLDAQGETLPLNGGESVPLFTPSQGGRVLFIGVRATNLDACGAELTASARDPVSNQVRLDGRTINLQPDGTGWGGSLGDRVDTQANVPVCPNQWSSADIPGNRYTLTVTLIDRLKRTAERTLDIRPTCLAEDVNCPCLCHAGYVLGQSCGGSPDGGQ